MLTTTADTSPSRLISLTAGERANTPRLEILFVGDTSFGESYQERYARRGGENILETRGYDYPMAKVAPVLRDVDLVIANLETPVTDLKTSPFKGQKPYIHWTDVRRAPPQLLKNNIRTVSLANNHAFDYGVEGFEQTLRVLGDNGFAVFGGGGNEYDASKPLIIDATIGDHHLRTAVFAAFDASRKSLRKFGLVARRDGAGLSTLDPLRIGAQIRELRAEDPEIFCIAFPHWGPNYKWRTDRQSVLADQLLKAGVDLILGHGAHMLQEIEYRNGRWVVFSLGNFVFNSAGRYEKMNAAPFSLLAKLVAVPDVSGLTLSLKLYPIVTDNKLTGYQTRFVDKEEFAQFRELLATESASTTFDRFGHDGVGRYLELQLTSPGSRVHTGVTF